MADELSKRLIASIDELKRGQDCLYQKMTELKVEFGRVDERLQNGSRRFDEIEQKNDELETRVRLLENKTAVIYGIAAFFGALAGIVAQLVSYIGGK